MFTARNLTRTIVPVSAGFLLWLGLSPRVAQRVYVSALLPRCREQAHVDDSSVLLPRKSVIFKTANDVELLGHLYMQHASKKIILYLAGRISNLSKNTLRAHALSRTGQSVFIFGYRGSGDTEGRATPKTWSEDALAAYDAVIGLGYDPGDVILYGESFGAALAVRVAASRKVAALILQSGFSKLSSQIKDMKSVFKIYPDFMFPEPKLASIDMLKKDHPPLLILHGDHDLVIGKHNAYRLAEAAGDNTTLVVLQGANHSDLYQRNDWLDAVNQFLSGIGQ